MINASDAAKRFGLLGFPLSHSLSPLIHEKLFSCSGVNGAYGLYEAKDELEGFYKSTLCALDGFNVTVPHKTNIIPLLDTLSERAALYGAVNTVSFENGRACGHNTDCTGFLRSLEGEDVTLGGSVLVLGCGGVSRMFVFESLLAGADVTVAVRPSGLEKAEAVNKETQEKLGKKLKIIDIKSVNEGYDLIINGTPSGMFPHIGEAPLEREAVIKSKAVFDAVYNPAETLLLRYACEGGLIHINGLSMLVWQAAAAQEIWNGVSFDSDTVKSIVLMTEKELEAR